MSNPGTPAAPAANPAPSSEGSPASALSDTELSDFFAAEPSQPVEPAVGATPAQPAAPASGTPPVQPAAATPAAPAPVAPAAPTAQPDNGLTEVVTSLRDAITNMGKKPGEGQPEPIDPLTTIPAYEITLPEPIMQQLNADDMGVRSKALGAVISATMKTVHKQVFDQMQLHFAQLREEIPRLALSQISERQTREQVSKDFYGTYPEYDKPMLRPVVQMAVVEVVKANPALAQAGRWTPELRDAVGAYMKANVPLVVQAAPATPPKAPKTPPVMVGTGTRPGDGPGLVGQEAELADMFG